MAVGASAIGVSWDSSTDASPKVLKFSSIMKSTGQQFSFKLKIASTTWLIAGEVF